MQKFRALPSSRNMSHLDFKYLNVRINLTLITFSSYFLYFTARVFTVLQDLVSFGLDLVSQKKYEAAKCEH